mmetsp:Transcript_28064/g.27073  ORF Transcript_28064/g.27073 Transcript_28064/m.27073 type:complete len:98 (-) Transcript_28064:276-569(-)
MSTIPNLNDELTNGAAVFFSNMGVVIALGISNLGAAYGTAKSGIGIASMGVLKPDLIVKSIVPIVMAGILGIYGLIVAVILIQNFNPSTPAIDGSQM